jgi:raffinose/stachyose/melibiose transport system permease protein
MSAKASILWSPRYRLRTALVYFVLGVFSLVILIPLLLILIAAFKSQNELMQSALSLPLRLSFQSFVDAWTTGKFSLYSRSSIIVLVPAVTVSVVLSVMSGYGLGMLRPPGGRILLGLFLLGLAVPYEAVIVPLYYRMLQFHMLNTYAALIWPQVALSVAFGTFWMEAFFSSIPRDLMDSAAIDGANHWTTLWKVLVPLGAPSILTMTVLIAIWTWNEFLLVLVMATRDEVRTLPVGLAFFQGQHLTQVNLQAAGSLIVALPMIFLYILFQRQFIRGILGGAVRG